MTNFIGANDILLCIIFHRQLGSNDESATDAEQGEKLLFYYPQETPLYNKISRLTF